MARLALATLLLVACEHGQSPIETAIVSPLRTPCQGFGPIMCLTMVPDQQPMERLFEGIQGYNHRWGTESEISFRREVVEPVPDGPSELVILIDVLVENETITAPFDLQFPFGNGWFSGGPDLFNMLGTTVQSEQPVSDQITAANVSGNPFTVTMELTEDDQTLHAIAVGP